jgi:hypothetical protein
MTKEKMPYNEEDVFYLDFCKKCNQFTALKNGICAECEKKDIPDFLKDIFGGFENEKDK